PLAANGLCLLVRHGRPTVSLGRRGNQECAAGLFIDDLLRQPLGMAEGWIVDQIPEIVLVEDGSVMVLLPMDDRGDDEVRYSFTLAHCHQIHPALLPQA